MELLTANTGSYPRVGESLKQQNLRWAYHDWEKGKITREKLEDIYQKVTREVILEQVRAGLDVVTDGQVRWYDPLSHFARKIGGCEIDGLLRFFDSNFYFRQPVIKDEIRWGGPILKDEFLDAKRDSPAPVKPVVTGPYTLARYSIDEYYHDFPCLATDFAEIIAREVRELSRSGADEVQIDEPAILQFPNDMDILCETTQEIAKANEGSRLLVHVYFGDPVPIYEKIQELPVNILGFDFTYSSRLPEIIKRNGSEKGLGLGLIDSRNTKVEKLEEVLPTIEKIVPHVNAERIYLNPSCGIEYLPREKAFEKLRNMVAIASKAKESSSILA